MIKQKIRDIFTYLNKRQLIILILIIPFIILFAYFIGSCGFILIDTTLTLQGAIDILTCFGTIFLGAIALIQNNKLDKVNRDLVSKSYAADHYTKIDAISIAVSKNNEFSILKHGSWSILKWDSIKNFQNVTYALNITFRIGFTANEYISVIKYNKAKIYTDYYEKNKDNRIIHHIIKADTSNLEGTGYQTDFTFVGEVSDYRIINENEIKEFQVKLAIQPIVGEKTTIYSIDMKNNCDLLKERLMKSLKNRFEVNVEVYNSFGVITSGIFYYDFELLGDSTNVLKKGFIATGIKLSEVSLN